MIEEKGLGKAKVNRVNISLSNKDNVKLNRLATACGMRPTTLAGFILEQFLSTPERVVDIQNEHGIYAAYKVLPVKNHQNGEVEYVLYDREMV